jgi:transcriptional regulator with XRE-family HTH domain
MLLKHAMGTTIRRLRTEQGLTLRQLAEPNYISYSYLSDIERGAKEVSSTILEAIADGLHLSTAQLLKEIYDYLEEHDG